ncbi:phospholipid scramblase 1-like [Leptopilina boulardi]|uniref:phospholipid scramblase 1-like n=1 Tax=Leptopilina boulardi TaxID=63433 RepID=UPI0021F58D84|nr:phospholipid scramblase 1-like [Leptopilina boulardi]
MNYYPKIVHFISYCHVKMSQLNVSEGATRIGSEAETSNEARELGIIFYDEIYDTRPVYSQPTVITSTTNTRDERAQNRRPIPVITSDWISTPRSQLSVLSGTYFLSGVEQLEIQRVIDLSTLLGTYKKGNQYKVKIPKAETLFLAIESSNENQRRFLKSSRPFTLNILDPSGETAFTITKDVGWGCLPGWLHKIKVESTEFIGTVEQKFTLLGPYFTVYDAAKNPLCYIEGPNVYSCCMYKEACFQVLPIDGSCQLASVMRKFDNNLADYILLLTFPENMNIKLKSLLLGATFLIEYLYFEGL